MSFAIRYGVFLTLNLPINLTPHYSILRNHYKSYSTLIHVLAVEVVVGYAMRTVNSYYDIVYHCVVEPCYRRKGMGLEAASLMMAYGK